MPLEPLSSAIDVLDLGDLADYLGSAAPASSEVQVEPFFETDCFGVDVSAPAYGVAHSRLLLRLDAPVYCRVDGGEAVWSLRARVTRAPALDCFRRVSDPLSRRLGALPHASVAHRRALNQLRRFAREAVARCQPAARAIALRFRAEDRLRIYRVVVGDPSGRLAQLAVSRPGVLNFAIGLTKRSDASIELGNALLAAFRAGVPVRRALGGVLVEYVDRTYFDDCDAVRARLVAAKRLQLERASARVRSDDLFATPEVQAAPEDIPSDPRDNGLWFDVVCNVGRDFVAGNDAPFRRFLAAHAVEAARRFGRDRAIALFTEVRDYCGATGRTPSRNSSLDRLLEESARWHRLPAALRRVGRRPRLDSTDLPRLEGADATVAGFAFRQLTTAKALEEEGEAMHHCVATYHEACALGGAFVFSVVGPASRLTVSVGRFRGVWAIDQIRGERNRLPTTEEQEVVEKWFRTYVAKREAPATPR